ncbi:MAG: type II toxin-antitoxin system Phd/YefM family antitoxin [Burkholderiaceae bacterium]
MSTLPYTLSLSEFRAKLADTLDLVEQGQTVQILRHGKPVAQVQPMPAEQAKVPRWKQPIFEPLNIVRADGKTGAQLIIEERESGW